MAKSFGRFGQVPPSGINGNKPIIIHIMLAGVTTICVFCAYLTKPYYTHPFSREKDYNCFVSLHFNNIIEIWG